MIGRELAHHARHCKLQGNCPLCWQYVLEMSRRSTNMALASLGVVACLLWMAMCALLFRRPS